MALRKTDRKALPWLLVLIVGIAWLLVIRYQAENFAVKPGEVDADVSLQYYDRELRLLEAGKRGNAFEQWLAETDRETEWLKESLATVEMNFPPGDREPLGSLLDGLAHRLGTPYLPAPGGTDPDYRREFREWLLAGHGRAWDYELFLAIREDLSVRKFYETENDLLMRRAWWICVFHSLLVGIGVVMAICLAFFRCHMPKGTSRVPDSWYATALLCCYFLSDILLMPVFWLLDLAYGIYFAIGGTFNVYPLYDLLWRAFGTVFLTVFFLKRPRNIIRVFRLRQRIDWPLVMAAFSLLIGLDWLLFSLAPVSEVDPTDFMEFAYLDIPALVSLLFSCVIVAPVFEEIVFRGFLFQGLRSKLGVLPAAIVSSLFFGMTHTQYDIWGWISVGVTGLVACYLTHHTGSIKSAITFHALINLVITLNVYLIYQLPL